MVAEGKKSGKLFLKIKNKILQHPKAEIAYYFFILYGKMTNCEKYFSTLSKSLEMPSYLYLLKPQYNSCSTFYYLFKGRHYNHIIGIASAFL